MPPSAMYPCSYCRLRKVHCLAFPHRFLLSALQEDSGNQELALLTGLKSSAVRPELARGPVPVPSPALQASDC